jgi:hypothetical protein
MYNPRIKSNKQQSSASDAINQVNDSNLRTKLSKRQEYAQKIAGENYLENGTFNQEAYDSVEWDKQIDDSFAQDKANGKSNVEHSQSYDFREVDVKAPSRKMKNIHRITAQKGIGIRPRDRHAFDSANGVTALQPFLYGNQDELNAYAEKSSRANDALNPSAQGVILPLQIFYYLYRNRAFNILLRKTAGIELVGESIQVADPQMRKIVMFFKEPVMNNAVAEPLVDGSTAGEVDFILNTRDVPIFNLQQRVVVGDQSQAILSKAGLSEYAEKTEIVSRNFNLFRDNFILSGYLPAGSKGLLQWAGVIQNLPFPTMNYGDYTASATYYNFLNIVTKFVRDLDGWGQMLTDMLKVDVSLPPERERMFFMLFESLPLSARSVIQANFNFRFVAWKLLSGDLNGYGYDLMVCIARPNLEGQPVCWEFFTNLLWTTGTLRGEDTTSTKFAMSYSGVVVTGSKYIQVYRLADANYYEGNLADGLPNQLIKV